MQIISEANQNVLKILRRFRKQGPCTRRLHYCVEEQTEDGILLFNLLTRELILLAEEEHQNLLTDEYLQEHWFVVPEESKDKEYVEVVRWVLSSRKKTKAITNYTIFTTTDCNARCFYCFELGRSRVPMDHEIALKTVRYIKEHCRGEKVRLSWFGGEPLLNYEAIDTICDGLRKEGVEFSSTMITNGYLFDTELVKKAVTDWRLKKVQITLDGTEEVYNRIKAFVHQEGSAYRRVMDNMRHLLDASIKISIRLNMDMHNAENLLELVDELGCAFDGRDGLSVYAYHIFEDGKPMAEIHTEEGWNLRHEAMSRLKERIEARGLSVVQGIRKKPKDNRCMADSGRSVTILPTGDIGLCEHHSENEFIGHLDREEVDEEMIAIWRETVPEIPECETCFYYPDCIRLKKCSNDRVCFRHLRMDYLESTKQAMRNEYKKWIEHTK